MMDRSRILPSLYPFASRFLDRSGLRLHWYAGDVSFGQSALDAGQDAPIVCGNADIFERPALVRGWENFLCDTSLNPDWADFILKKFLAFFVESNTKTVGDRSIADRFADVENMDSLPYQSSVEDERHDDGRAVAAGRSAGLGALSLLGQRRA